ncbi:hypothetical protein ACFOYZ_29940, partial [Neobacillus cucumis]|uniref:hypothetical protein n=1 Tax=Neobacillus cucumis TaxID=1740721 RepID=UPI0036208CAD
TSSRGVQIASRKVEAKSLFKLRHMQLPEGYCTAKEPVPQDTYSQQAWSSSSKPRATSHLGIRSIS